MYENSRSIGGKRTIFGTFFTIVKKKESAY